MHKLLYKSYMRQHHFRDEMAMQCNATYRPDYQIRTSRKSCVVLVSW